MVSLTVTTQGKPTINIDFAGKHPQGVTVKDLKSAIQAKIPKVSQNDRDFQV
jgi:very-long-chain enoyl-CoA reductase